MRRTRWWLLPLVLLIGLGISGVVAGWWLLGPTQPNATTTQVVNVPKGSTVNQVAADLQAAGLVHHSAPLIVVMRLTDQAGQLQAGSFALSPSMNVFEIAETLTSAANPNDVVITIPEGWRREEIAASLAEEDLPNFDSFEFLQLSQGDEGKLFPDTYHIAKEATAADIHELLLATFERKVIDGLAGQLPTQPADLNRTLVLASLVEREGRGREQMAQIAGILNNRLDIGMALQVDATLQYLTGYDEAEETWWQTPLNAHKAIDSPYNTYLYPGLPPAPIANPGLLAIEAVLDPIPSDYLYYLHAPDGSIYFATDLATHQLNINRYLR